MRRSTPFMGSNGSQCGVARWNQVMTHLITKLVPLETNRNLNSWGQFSVKIYPGQKQKIFFKISLVWILAKDFDNPGWQGFKSDITP